MPPTGLIDGPCGEGSVQQIVDSIDGKFRITEYPKVQRQQMAVLDYIMANTDRHLDNYRTAHNGDVIAIDHGLTFPEEPDPKYGIRSDFVKAFQHKDLDKSVLDAVRAVHPEDLRAALSDLELSDKAINGALARLHEIQSLGKITGREWPDILRVTKHGRLDSQ
ncbi:hypothetical protein ACLMAJ_32475 [Nocardia sp. KC 131]|uniref:hypothetical protein n=1 Tax=Nocardia arseniciresistens TaxID=3392119 RepID=UPI00398F36F5